MKRVPGNEFLSGPSPRDGTSEERVAIRTFPRDQEGVAPVIAEVLLVAVTVVAAGFVYFMVSNLALDVESQAPFVTFGPANVEGGSATFVVAAALEARLYSEYRVNLVVDGIGGSPSALSPATILSVGSVSYEVTYLDLGGEGVLNGGDRFHVAALGGPLPRNSHFSFFLLQSSGSFVQLVSWTTR